MPPGQAKTTKTGPNDHRAPGKDVFPRSNMVQVGTVSPCLLRGLSLSFTPVCESRLLTYYP